MLRMGNDGAHRLSEYPWPMVEFRWDKCGRYGKLRKARLLAEYGDMKGPELLLKIAADCPRVGNSYYDRCGIYYPALAKSTKALRPQRQAE